MTFFSVKKIVFVAVVAICSILVRRGADIETKNVRAKRGVGDAQSECIFPTSIALSFDYPQTNSNTLELLAMLKKLNVFATFFIYEQYHFDTEQIKLYKMISNDGHSIGFNFVDGEYRNDRLNRAAFINAMSYKVLSIQKQLGFAPKSVRFPKNFFDNGEYDIAREIGYLVTESSINTPDWDNCEEPEILKDSIFRHYNDSIMPFANVNTKPSFIGSHISCCNITLAIENVVNILRQKYGYLFVTTEQCVGFVAPKYFEATKIPVAIESPISSSIATSTVTSSPAPSNPNPQDSGYWVYGSSYYSKPGSSPTDSVVDPNSSCTTDTLTSSDSFYDPNYSSSDSLYDPNSSSSCTTDTYTDNNSDYNPYYVSNSTPGTVSSSSTATDIATERSLPAAQSTTTSTAASASATVNSITTSICSCCHHTYIFDGITPISSSSNKTVITNPNSGDAAMNLQSNANSTSASSRSFLVDPRMVAAQLLLASFLVMILF